MNRRRRILPHASEALVHRHILLQDLLCRMIVIVVLVGHEVDWIYKKGGRSLQSFARAKKCKGTGVVASVDVFEAGALGWYLKPQSKEVDASGRAKGNRN